jgi:protein-tyrosine phosphatase
MWIHLDGLVNLRDLGGTPTTDGGTIAPRRLLRSDNLQGLTPSAINHLLEIGLSDVVDLRSTYEVMSEGPGPLTERPEVTIHHHSFFREDLPGIGDPKPDVRVEVLPEEALPWVELEPTIQVDNPVTSVYLSYLVDRPDSVVRSLRTIAYADGATLVHCAAGKDRTGTLVALALVLAGADRDAVVADYAASSERMQQIVDRLMASETYADNLRGRPLSSHLTYAETMEDFLDYVENTYGGVEKLLRRFGWSDADTDQLRAKLRG